MPKSKKEATQHTIDENIVDQIPLEESKTEEPKIEDIPAHEEPKLEDTPTYEAICRANLLYNGKYYEIDECVEILEESEYQRLISTNVIE